MSLRAVLVDLERNGAPEIQEAARADFRCARDILNYLVGLDPSDRSTEVPELRREIARALGHQNAEGSTEIRRLLDPGRPRESWNDARRSVAIDRWPRLVDRPVLGPMALGVIAVIPFLIAAAAWFITKAAVVAILSGVLATGWIIGFVMNRLSERRAGPEPRTLTLDDVAHLAAQRRRELGAMPDEFFSPSSVRKRLEALLSAHDLKADLDAPFPE